MTLEARGWLDFVHPRLNVRQIYKYKKLNFRRKSRVRELKVLSAVAATNLLAWE